MGRRRRVPARTIIFIGCEGKSERALVRFLAHLCEEAGLHLHLDAKPGNGGDSVSVVREARRHLEKHPDRKSIKDSFVLLDRHSFRQPFRRVASEPADDRLPDLRRLPRSRRRDHVKPAAAELRIAGLVRVTATRRACCAT